MHSKQIITVFLLALAMLGMASCSLIAESPETPTHAAPADSNGGTVIIRSVTVPAGEEGAFTFTGVPTGTISVDGTLVVSNLHPGTYSTTEVDPAPGFDVTAIECDDATSATASSGDAQTRTAVLNVDPGETVTCTFTNTRRGSIVVVGQTVPSGSTGSFTFTGSPTGTIPADGTLVVANLTPGTYTSTEVDPAPDYDLTSVECDDATSRTASSGDAETRTAIFNLDPGELVTCRFTNTRRGTLVVANLTVPGDAEGSFLFTGVPSGTIPANGTLVVSNLSPGTYTTTEADPAPAFEVTAIECDDGNSASSSSGDPATRTAVFNLDAGESVNCTFTNTELAATITPTLTSGGTSSGEGPDPGSGEPGAGDPVEGINPFDNPDDHLAGFPLPPDLPPGAGSFSAPKPGPWAVTHYSGQMSCGAIELSIPASPPESGILEVLDGGRTLIGTGLEDAQGVSITMSASPTIKGRYTGAFQGTEQGVPVTINYFWQVVTDEYIVGYLTSSFTSEGVTCNIYRAFELSYTG